MLPKQKEQAPPLRKWRIGVISVIVTIAACAIVVTLGSFVIICGCGPNDGAVPQEGQTRERRVPPRQGAGRVGVLGHRRRRP